MEGTVSRAEMMAKPFEPIGGAQNEFQNAHSLSYIAFYLGEIDKSLKQIASTLQATTPNSAAIALNLRGVIAALQSKT